MKRFFLSIYSECRRSKNTLLAMMLVTLTSSIFMVATHYNKGTYACKVMYIESGDGPIKAADIACMCKENTVSEKTKCNVFIGVLPDYI